MLFSFVNAKWKKKEQKWSIWPTKINLQHNMQNHRTSMQHTFSLIQTEKVQIIVNILDATETRD